MSSPLWFVLVVVHSYLPWCHVLLDVDLNTGLTLLANNLEREVLHVLLNVLIAELAPDKTLDVKDCSVRVRGELILGCALC